VGPSESMTTLAVMPLPEEHGYLDAALRAAGLEGAPATIGPIAMTRFPAIGLITAHGGHGKTQFGIQTRYLLDTLPGVDCVICAGAAGALDASLAVGDIVLGETTVEHDYLLKFATRPLPAFPGSSTLRERYATVAETLGLVFHVGKIASGDEDIIETDRGAELAALTGAIAVAWEGAGAARACMLTGTPWLEIRAVTDTADHTAPGDFETNLELAMTNIGTLLAASLNADR
jgi:adenosylhomocysteine nucleosidase